MMMMTVKHDHLEKEESLTPGKSVFAYAHKQSVSPRKLYVLTALCAIVVISSISYLLYTGERMSVRRCLTVFIRV